MIITRKILAESEGECTSAPSAESMDEAIKAVARMKFYLHARIMLPEMHELVREMYHALEHVLCCKAEDEETYLPVALCLRCNDARRLVERMEMEEEK